MTDFMHKIVRLPVGADEGVPYLRLTGTPPGAAADAVPQLREIYRARALTGVWLDLPEYQSNAAVALIGYLRAWLPVYVYQPISFRGWPAIEARLAVDASALLAERVIDWTGWAMLLAEQRAVVPDAIDEMILRRPHRKSLVPSALDAIDEAIGAATAGFIYVEPADIDYAVEVSSRARRPWVVRPADTEPAAAPPP